MTRRRDTLRRDWFAIVCVAVLNGQAMSALIQGHLPFGIERLWT